MWTNSSWYVPVPNLIAYQSGSQSFDQHLTELFQKQIIDVTEARRLASNPDALNLALRGISNSDTRLR